MSNDDAWRELAEDYKAAMKVFRMERDLARSELRSQRCIRPPNSKPDEYTVGECVDDDNCGCGCVLALHPERPDRPRPGDVDLINIELAQATLR